MLYNYENNKDAPLSTNITACIKSTNSQAVPAKRSQKALECVEREVMSTGQNLLPKSKIYSLA